MFTSTALTAPMSAGEEEEKEEGGGGERLSHLRCPRGRVRKPSLPPPTPTRRPDRPALRCPRRREGRPPGSRATPHRARPPLRPAGFVCACPAGMSRRGRPLPSAPRLPPACRAAGAAPPGGGPRRRGRGGLPWPSRVTCEAKGPRPAAGRRRRAARRRAISTSDILCSYAQGRAANERAGRGEGFGTRSEGERGCAGIGAGPTRRCPTPPLPSPPQKPLHAGATTARGRMPGTGPTGARRDSDASDGAITTQAWIIIIVTVHGGPRTKSLGTLTATAIFPTNWNK